MATDAEQFETIATWQREDTMRGRTNPTSCAATKTNSLQAIRVTGELIDSLRSGRWHMITTARLSGATWDDIAHSMSYPDGHKSLRAEYAGLVSWYTKHASVAVDVDHWRAALDIDDGSGLT